jgi:putative aminopeptidase FrvX
MTAAQSPPTGGVADDSDAIDFLLQLLDTPAPSGFEEAASRVWAERAQAFADVSTDSTGNTYARVHEGAGPKVAICGHLDEIGLIVTKVDDKGFIRVTNIGGWDVAVLVGQRVRILARDGVVYGSLGRAAIHTIEPSARDKMPKLKDLWIDIGAEDGEDARARVRVGDPVVLDVTPRRLGDHRIMSRSLDDRLGSFAALEAVRRLAARSEPATEVIGIGSATEEIGGPGALTATYSTRPDVAIVVEVTSPGDTPGSDVGDYGVGKGPIITRGATTNARIVQQLIDAAEAEGIDYQLRGMGGRTNTDADKMVRAGEGVPMGLVCIPGRYLHTPCEQADLRDVEATISLLCAFAERFGAASQ